MPVKAIINKEELRENLAFDEASLDTAMQEQASLFFYYSAKAAGALKQMEVAKNRMELVYAQVDKRVRDEAAENGRKVTEKVIEAEVLASEEYQAAKLDYIDAKTVNELVKNVPEAFKQKRDMLVQFSKSRLEDAKGAARVAASAAVN